MRVLHLSDLHVTEPGQNLATGWLDLERALSADGELRFDFVVVSGDLTQRASPAEYAELKTFTESHLLPLLPRRERARVIFVPGNHDVDWSAEVGQPVRLASPSADLAWVERELSRYHSVPEQSELRLEVGKYGHLELVRLDPLRYPARLQNAQSFLDGFYGDALAPRGRLFQLTAPSPEQHFSAHVFADEGVAFFGFSSLHANDRYFPCAAISRHAVAAAREFARGLDPLLLKVAVWHHGFSAERGRPDSLTAQDVGMLHAAGFRVGFHGHTHRARTDVSELFDDRFAISSTGSYGAASRERPDAVGNQFSVVRLNATSLSTDVYERSGEAAVYARVRRRTHELISGPQRGAAFSQTWAERHRRGFRVRKDGIARATVELEGFTAEPEVPLAVVMPPFCSVLADETATSPMGRVQVLRRPRDDGRIGFVLQEADQRRYPRLAWSYHLSNALSLTRAELSLLQERRRWFPNLDDHHDICCHTVRFQSDRFELHLEYEPDTGVTVESAYALVERRLEVGGELLWVRSDEEERRCKITGIGGSRVELAVPGPLVGARYGIAFTLATAGEPYDPILSMNSGELLKQCMGAEPGAPGSLAHRLEQALFPVLAPGGALSSRTTVMGMFWDGARRLLRPAFGRFWVQSWASRFACGEGVAGHAFRFALPAAWHREVAQARHETSILFQDYPEHYVQPRHYRWVLSLPLKATERTCIGVVTLASEEDDGQPADHALARIARVTAAGLHDAAAIKQREELQRAVNYVFWSAIAEAPDLLESIRSYAREVLSPRK